jgi:hypothetical protein
MANPTIRIYDVITNELVDREMTDQEYADHLAACEASLAEIQSLQA